MVRSASIPRRSTITTQEKRVEKFKQVGLRLDDDHIEWLKRQAEANERTMSGEARMVFRRAMEADDAR